MFGALESFCGKFTPLESNHITDIITKRYAKLRIMLFISVLITLRIELMSNLIHKPSFKEFVKQKIGYEKWRKKSDSLRNNDDN